MEIGLSTVDGKAGTNHFSGAATHYMHAVRNLDAIFPVCRNGVCEGQCLATTIP